VAFRRLAELVDDEIRRYTPPFGIRLTTNAWNEERLMKEDFRRGGIIIYADMPLIVDPSHHIRHYACSYAVSEMLVARGKEFKDVIRRAVRHIVEVCVREGAAETFAYDGDLFLKK
jgi:hypothetical protein